MFCLLKASRLGGGAGAGAEVDELLLEFVLYLNLLTKGNEETSKRRGGILSAQPVYTAQWSLHSSVSFFHGIPRGAPCSVLLAACPRLSDMYPPTAPTPPLTPAHIVHTYFCTQNCTLHSAIKTRQEPAGTQQQGTVRETKTVKEEGSDSSC
ncbi:hypothetical protein PAMA_006398 [Pampus argenteus]